MRVMTDKGYNFEYVNIDNLVNLDFGIRITKSNTKIEKYPVYGGGGESFKFDDYNRESSWVLSRFAMSENCVRFVFGKFYLLDSGATISIKKEWANKVNLDYIGYFLLSHQTEIFKKYARGQGQKNLDVGAFKKQMSVPIPSKKIQDQIVSQLEKLEKIKEKREQNIQRCDELIKSIFYDMFGDPNKNERKWDIKKLGTICIDNPLYGSGASGITFDNKIRYVRITDITENGTLSNNNIVSPSIIEEKYLLKDGDLLFARSGATVGKTYLHNNDNKKYIFAGYLIRFRLNKDICNPKFVEAITKTYYYFEWIKNQQTAVAQPNINAKQYSSFNLFIPPIEHQNEFAKKVKVIDKLKEKQIKSKEEIDNLFNALMQKYFRE